MNYFMNYKSLNNRKSELRFYSKDKVKRLYVDKALIGKYLYLCDNKDNGLIVKIGLKDKGLKVNKQAFISLNRLSDKAWLGLCDKPLAYDMGIKAMLNA